MAEGLSPHQMECARKICEGWKRCGSGKRKRYKRVFRKMNKPRSAILPQVGQDQRYNRVGVFRRRGQQVRESGGVLVASFS